MRTKLVSSITLVTTSIAMLSAGCTKWGTTTVYGPSSEIGRVLRGSPHIAETSSSSLTAGFAGARGDRVAVAGLSGDTSSMKRTHCVQEAEITYERPYDMVPEPKGRVNDVAGAVLLGFLGLGVIAAAKIRSHTIFEPGDPLYETPPSPGPGYALGGGMIIGGGILLGYSFGSLPKGPKPQVVSSKKHWNEVQLVEATGCGLPGENVAVAQPTPAPVAAPVPRAPAPTVAPTASHVGDETATRLKKLDSLRASGAISDAEYKRKRKEIIDSI